MIRILAAALAGTTCLAAFATPASAQAATQATNFRVPAGSLRSALDAFVRQSGRQVIFRGDEVGSQTSPGVEGVRTPEDALNAILSGTGFTVQRDTSGAFAVVRAAQVSQSGGEVDAGAVSLADQSVSDNPSEDIVVTGTLIRGIAPIGTNVVSLDRQQIAATGAINTNDVLAKIPQITNFFNRVVTSGLGASGTGKVASPDIRGLSTFGGGNTTLMLLDGQRLAGVGVIYTSPDPDVVPPGALERAEVMADGGSAIYGSDAVGGVINLITQKRVQGLSASGRYGFADNYYQYDANATAGTQWSSGGAYVSATYSKHDDLFGRDRDYIRNITPSNSCASPTLTIGATQYALPGLVPGTVNECDTARNEAWVPAERRYSIFAGLNQDLGENIELNVRGYYTNRRTNFLRDEARASVAVPANNPNYIAALGGTQSVAFSYGPVFGENQTTRTDLEQWGVIPSLSYKFAPQWELRLSAAYSESDVRTAADMINSAAQTAALSGTLAATPGQFLNPYNVASTDPAVLDAIGNWQEYSRGRQNVLSARGVIDGTLFSWAGGDVRVAAGGEYMREEINSTLGQRVPGSNTALPNSGGSRNTKSAFGEIVAPIFGPDNRVPGFYSLQLSASARYDHYNDFGSTFNPKFGIDWRPFSALRLRGNYGTSFNAPSLADINAVDQRVDIQVASVFNILLLRPGDAAFPNILRPVFIVAGGNPDLRPQKAKTFSLGFDFDAPFAPGLRFSATYWNIDFKDQISLPTNCLFNSNAPVCSRFVIANPTIDQVNALTPGFLVSGALPSIAAAYANPFLPPYALLDARRVNIGRVKTDGVDFSASYVRPTSFGAINANVGGSNTLNRNSVFLGQANDDLAFGVSTLNLTAGVGATIGNFGVQASLLHTAGYDTAGSGTTPGMHVKAFNVANLFFSYNLKGEGMARDLAFTLSVNNVFDQDPPFVNTGNGYANGSTLGRLVQFGVSKKF